MVEQTTRAGLTRLSADGTDDGNDWPVHQRQAVNRIDELLGTFVCTSTTRPSASEYFTGMLIYETDTGFTRIWSGGSWQLIVTTGPWQSYTPTWINLTVGNGTVEGRWRRVAGSLVDVHIFLRLGTTSTMTANQVVFSLPVAVDINVTGAPPIGQGVLTDAGSGYYGVIATRALVSGAQDNSKAMLFPTNTVAPSGVTGAVPFSFTNLDAIEVGLLYNGAAG